MRQTSGGDDHRRVHGDWLAALQAAWLGWGFVRMVHGKYRGGLDEREKKTYARENHGFYEAPYFPAVLQLP